ncbi:MAG: zinc ribbon domain-containing protein [Stigonema ocellatum SAG 48.90 = DSM 106950]|nr:zinc ribbon domain-containing protein [Stigonema ocellatum SAG 48.90 = DSM 106950]
MFIEYLEATIKGEEAGPIQGVRFCPNCWKECCSADPIWSNVKAKYCYLCGTQLRASCDHRGELVVSLKYKFCPICGKPYKPSRQKH